MKCFKPFTGCAKLLEVLKCSKRSCLFIGVLSLTLQFFLFMLLIYNIVDNNLPKAAISSCSLNLCEDIKRLTRLGKKFGIKLINLDRNLIKLHLKYYPIGLPCKYCPLSGPVIIGVESGTMMAQKYEYLKQLIDDGFIPITFYNRQPVQPVSELSQVEIALFLHRTSIIQIVILHPREDNTWWFGDIHSDNLYEAKLATLNLTLDHLVFQNSEGTIQRVEIFSTQDNPNLMLPRNVTRYLSDIEHSRFIECNHTRAQVFHNRFGTDSSPDALWFRHKAWKLLSRVKTVLDSINIEFWLSSGTALGYLRECDIIPYSKDVDIGVFASSYSDKMISEMQDHGFKLKISLGIPNDSLELSFVDKSGIKLDIFFFYEDGDFYWNGGTQVKSGKKFKYTFPKFTLCWTIFKDLHVRVPCETETYIRSNYGPHWFRPVKTWDWKTSPFNVHPNGVWRADQLTKSIKLFE